MTAEPRGRIDRAIVFAISTLRFGAGVSVFLFYGLTLLAIHRRGPRALFRYSQRMLRLVLRAIGIRIAVEGREHLKRDVSYVYLFNHTSFLDHLFVTGTVPGFIVGVEKTENFRKPVYGRMVRWWGNIEVDRASPRSGVSAIRQARRLLRDGTSVGLAPEGTRSHDGAVGPFKTGGFEIAALAHRPVVPVSLIGVLGVNPDGQFHLRAGFVRIVYGSPIDVEACSSQAEAIAQVRAAMAAAGLTV